MWWWLGCGVPTATVTAPTDPVLADLADDPLTWTAHARCRVACRHIGEDEVAALLRTGHVVPERSRDDGACPSHAVEGPGADGRPLRIVYAACPDETRVVTAIDLGTDWPCDCD